MKLLLQNLIPRPIQIYAEFDGQAHFSCFRAEISCLIEIGPKIQSRLIST